MPTTYLGFDVLEIEPEADREQSYTRSVLRLDNKTGKMRGVDRTGVAVVEAKGFRWLMEGRAEIQAYRDFITARKGTVVPFWVPTWKHDMELVADILNTGNTLTISRMGYTKFMFAQPARRHLAIFLPGSSTPYYRKITAASEAASTETLTLDANIPVTVPKDGSMVSFLTLVRLAVDDPELAWHNRDVAEALLDFVELPREVPA